jgi:hypothetical protein
MGVRCGLFHAESIISQCVGADTMNNSITSVVEMMRGMSARKAVAKFILGGKRTQMVRLVPYWI